MRISNDKIWINCEENGKTITICDCRNQQLWELSKGDVVFNGQRDQEKALEGLKFQYASMQPTDAVQLGDSVIHVAYEGLWQGVSYTLQIHYELFDDYVEVTLPAGNLPSEIQGVSLPGSFKPAAQEARYLIPIMQGMYWDGRGEDFDWSIKEGSHGGFSLAMFGMLGETGGLLITAECGNDLIWRVGKENGKPYLSNIQRASLGKMNYDRKVRLYPVESTITAVMKRYRKRLIEKKRFVTWAEKIKNRPELERLFGTVFGFTGYCRDDIDYVEECKKLKSLGFTKAHLFPVRFNTFSEGYQMGGFPPVDYDEKTVAEIKALGFDVAPWSWICEALDDGTEEIHRRYRIYHDGETRVSWEIDDFKWHKTCNDRLSEYQEEAIRTGVCKDLTWDHFDVMACACNLECYALDHASHLGRPLDRTEDRELIRQLFITAQAGGLRPISSEGFNDQYSLEYDIGSVLAWPQYEPFDFWPIPMTMLVFHDSMIHTWWEVHGYNDDHFGRDCGKYHYGGGKPKLMSAMDALYGNPPFVFPFGAQYGWTGNGTETMLYKYRLEDPITRLALERAKDVARLHERIGKLEMIDFSFASPHHKVQKTTFAGGITVYANFDHCLHYIPGVGTLEGESWKVVYPD